MQTCIGKVIALSDAMEIVNSAAEAEPCVMKYDERIEKLRGEEGLCNDRRKNLYEDFKDGILSKDEYFMLREQYQGRIADIEKNILSLEAERDGIIRNGSGKQEWIERLKEYGNVLSLDRELVAFLIERIDVFNNSAIQVTYRFQKAIDEMEHAVELYSKEAV